MRKKELERKLKAAEAERDKLAGSKLDQIRRHRRIRADAEREAELRNRETKRAVYLAAFGKPERDGGLPIGKIQIRRPLEELAPRPRLEIVVDGIALCELVLTSFSVDSDFGLGGLATAKIEMSMSDLVFVEGRIGT